jgi:hypothetical protein
MSMYFAALLMSANDPKRTSIMQRHWTLAQTDCTGLGTRISARRARGS